jgi:hypothetical protein
MPNDTGDTGSKTIDFTSFERTLQPKPTDSGGMIHGSQLPPPEVTPSRSSETSAAPVAKRLAAAVKRERAVEKRAAAVAAQEQTFQQRVEPLLTPEYRAQASALSQQAAIAQHDREAMAYVRENAETFELTVALGAEAQVPDLQRAYWERTGQLLTHHEAAELVEQFVESQLDSIRGTKKGRELLASNSKWSRSTSATRPAAAPSADWTDKRPVDDAERYRRAKAAMDAVFGKGR